MNTARLVLYKAAIVLLASAIPVVSRVVNKVQHFRAYDQADLNVFEALVETDAPFEEMSVGWGAAFTQQFQGVDHENPPGGLADLGAGFNTATANLNLDVQLAEGIRVNLISYLSSRHHPEAWVKGGYLQVDKLTILENEMIDNLTKDWWALAICNHETQW